MLNFPAKSRFSECAECDFSPRRNSFCLDHQIIVQIQRYFYMGDDMVLRAGFNGNRRERLRHSIHHPAQTCAKSTCEDGNIDAEEREGWGNSHGVISEESDASSPKTMSPECGKWLVGSDNWHSMVDGFSRNQSVERV